MTITQHAEMQRLQEIEDQARYVRFCQKLYFTDRTRHNLHESKRAEKLLDTMLAADGSGARQARLFGTQVGRWE